MRPTSWRWCVASCSAWRPIHPRSTVSPEKETVESGHSSIGTAARACASWCGLLRQPVQRRVEVDGRRSGSKGWPGTSPRSVPGVSRGRVDQEPHGPQRLAEVVGVLGDRPLLRRRARVEHLACPPPRGRGPRAAAARRARSGRPGRSTGCRRTGTRHTDRRPSDECRTTPATASGPGSARWPSHVRPRRR